MMRTILFCLVLFGPTSLPAPPVGLPIEVESLGLHFETPDGWRLDSNGSSPTDLLLYPGKTKTLPLLRIRAFHGNFSARDRLPQMIKGLTDEEGGALFESVESWEMNGRRFETVTAVHRKGVQEWHARFTLVDQPKKLQHAFWLFGRKKDLERQWKAVSTSIASARPIGSPEPPVAKGDDPKPPEEGPPVDEGSFTWQDVQSGLRLTSWPAGFQPDEKSLSRLSRSGVILRPEDTEAPKVTSITLSRRNVSPMVTAESAAQTLKEKVLALSGVSEVRQMQVRVAGLPATLLRWRQQEGENDALVFQVYFFQRESALFRVDYSATEEWANVRKRRDLLKKFVTGISFR